MNCHKCNSIIEKLHHKEKICIDCYRLRWRENRKKRKDNGTLKSTKMSKEYYSIKNKEWSINNSDKVRLYAKEARLRNPLKHKARSLLNTAVKIGKTGTHYTERYLQSLFPEAFKRDLEIGRWYVYGRSLLNYQGLNHKDLIQAYGFLGDNSWMETSNCGNDFKFWKEATPEEVESALIAEAKKRGYKKGVTCVFGSAKEKRQLGTDCFFLANNNLCVKEKDSDNADIIFKNGNWAEILPEEKTIITKGKALRIIAKKLTVSPESIEIQ